VHTTNNCITYRTLLEACICRAHITNKLAFLLTYTFNEERKKAPVCLCDLIVNNRFNGELDGG